MQAMLNRKFSTKQSEAQGLDKLLMGVTSYRNTCNREKRVIIRRTHIEKFISDFLISDSPYILTRIKRNLFCPLHY
jgi:hypothetical protein